MWLIIPGAKNKKTTKNIRLLLISQDASRMHFCMQDNIDNHLMSRPKMWWGHGWSGGGWLSTVQRKAVEDQMILYTLLWWPFSPSAIQYCIPAFDPSLKHTSVVTNTHTHTYIQTLQHGWPTSGQMRQHKMGLVGKMRGNKRVLVCYLSVQRL